MQFLSTPGSESIGKIPYNCLDWCGRKCEGGTNHAQQRYLTKVGNYSLWVSGLI